MPSPPLPPAPPIQAQANYVEIDRLENTERIVAVFSQRKWDGKITFSLHREFSKIDYAGAMVTSKTAFVPEDQAASYVAMVTLATSHLDKLRAKRRAGQLPFPEGGLGDDR